MMPVLQITLPPCKKIISEPGEFSWMTDNMHLHTTTSTGGIRGLFGALGRTISGGGLFMTEYSPSDGPHLVAFAAKILSTIHHVEVSTSLSYMSHNHGFLCATEGVNLATGFQRQLGAGLFSGSGFIMQKLTGTCDAFVELCGETLMYNLQPGQAV